MKLKVAQIREFKKIASGIKTNQTLPILSYLKFEDGHITKNNLESFVTMKADFEGNFLLDEISLFSFVDSVSADEIDVEIKGTQALFTCGEEKHKSPTEDISGFLVLPEFTGEPFIITPQILEEIKTAALFTQDIENMPYASCIFVGRGLIGACINHMAYTKLIEGLPEIVIERDSVQVLKNFDSLEFVDAGNYICFSNGNFRFGFIKKDTKFLPLNPFTVAPNGKKAEIEKSEIIKFCDSCISACMGRFIQINVENGKMHLVDSAYGIEKEKPCELEDFGFNPTIMSKLLKSLPDEKITFIKADRKYYMTGPGGYVALIMEISK